LKRYKVIDIIESYKSLSRAFGGSKTLFQSQKQNNFVIIYYLFYSLLEMIFVNYEKKGGKEFSEKVKKEKITL